MQLNMIERELVELNVMISAYAKVTRQIFEYVNGINHTHVYCCCQNYQSTSNSKVRSKVELDFIGFRFIVRNLD